ncbi:hypothetical protein RUM43_001849 [Polyplax serrata]|uniref:Netrin n=1 Tax=Polyplax serrata TaxID=468196 RepID=A0AAN8SEY5_POLSC
MALVLKYFPLGLLLVILLAENTECGIGSGDGNFFKIHSQGPSDPCYDDNKPKKCVPDFVNAAFGKSVQASSVCGVAAPVKYCDIPETPGTSNCHICDDSVPKKHHPASYLTDLNNANNVTCWRSEPMVAPSLPNGPPDNVTFTLALGKKYELTYISLQFCPHALRPDSIAIYKSMDYGKTWQPFQFYSGQCKKVYGRSNKAIITKANEQEALCTDSHKFTSESSKSINRIAFSTLEDRPSARDFDNSPVLQDWVTATNIKVVFNRLYFPQNRDDGYNDPLLEKSRKDDRKSNFDIRRGYDDKRNIYERKKLEEKKKAFEEKKQNRPVFEANEDVDDVEDFTDIEDDDDDLDEKLTLNLNLNKIPSPTKIPPILNGNQMQKHPAVESGLKSQMDGNSNGIPKFMGPMNLHASPLITNNLVTSTTTTTMTYQYSVSDFAVGGRCKCNGHASKCIPTGRDGQLTCDCKHNTAGRDCERCKPFYFDRPWGRATERDANECKGKF